VKLEPGDAFRLDGQLCLWVGWGRITKGNGTVPVDMSRLEYVERVRFDALPDYLQEKAAQVSVDLSKYDGCSECGAWTGNPCRLKSGRVMRRPHSTRPKLKEDP
jgi:hypothetical protein